MRRSKPGLFLASAIIAIGLSFGPSVAQNSAGVNEYYYEHTDCMTGCGPLAGADRPAVRVQRTTGALYEYVIIGPNAQSAAVLDAVEQVGGSVIRSSALGALNQSTQIATFPNRAAFEQAQALIATQAPESALSLHHLFYFAQAQRSPRLYAPALIGDAEAGRCRVSRAVAIGMIDGPLNPNHPALQGANLRYETLVSGTAPDADHGTAVAALLVGQDPSGALAGYAQGASLYAISVFGARETVEEASVERIVQALDRMVGAGVRLINLSIAGPENQALGRALHAAASQGVVLVAASGNDQRPLVSWPAASQDVIAVTAIDAARRRFRRANTGEQIEFSAPGVDIYTASSSGGGYVSGTSFAAPIVTALAARQMAQGAGSVDAIRGRLRAGVETLGPGSRNTEFGWGLVKTGGC